ncbi:MAG: glycosyltransferase, partial [Synechococcales bacterium]|nr:glycosyltransferase [Synechococcales bacterium]
QEINMSQLDGSIKLLFFTSSLGGGGAEMHLLRILNHLDRNRFQLSLALAQAGGAYESRLAKDVALHHLNTGAIASSTLRMMRAIVPLRRLIQREQPDVVCSVLDHANLAALIATQGLAARPTVVLNVENTLSAQYRYQRSMHPTNWLLRSLIPILYPKADHIIAASQGVAHDLKYLVPSVSDRISVIYRACVDQQVQQSAAQPLPHGLPVSRPLIVACGRLTEQKGFLSLLDTFAIVRQSIPASLWIIGEGPQRAQLEARIQNLKLTDCVSLLGFQANPYALMQAADLFVLSSRYEGFGIVIVEAMACGTPVIAVDCPSGPSEIISHGVNGLLVPPDDRQALASSIVNLLNNSAQQAQLAIAGRQRAQNFHSQTIAATYGQLFRAMVPVAERSPVSLQPS